MVLVCSIGHVLFAHGLRNYCDHIMCARSFVHDAGGKLPDGHMVRFLIGSIIYLRSCAKLSGFSARCHGSNNLHKFKYKSMQMGVMRQFSICDRALEGQLLKT